MIENPFATLLFALALIGLDLVVANSREDYQNGWYLAAMPDGVWRTSEVQTLRLDGRWQIFDSDAESADGLARAIVRAKEPGYTIRQRVQRRTSGVYATTAEMWLYRLDLEPQEGQHPLSDDELRELRRVFLTTRNRDKRLPEGMTVEELCRGWADARVVRPWGYVIDAGAAASALGLAWSLLWVPRAPGQIRAAMVRHRERRNDSSRCPQCGYSVVGLRDAVCPECGRVLLGSSQQE